jgi:predicted DNA-binding protein (UPF0278 family)
MKKRTVVEVVPQRIMKKKDVHVAEPPPNAISAAVTEPTFEETVFKVRDALLQGLRLLDEVARRRDDSRAMKSIQPIVETLQDLPQRIVQSQLPAPVVRLILNDARLDSIIVYSDVRVSLMYDHQELIAPNEKLRNQVREFREQAEYAGSGWIDTSGLDVQQALVTVQNDLKLVEEANHLIRFEGMPA